MLGMGDTGYSRGSVTGPMMASNGFGRESRQGVVNVEPVSTAKASGSPRTTVVTRVLTYSLVGSHRRIYVCSGPRPYTYKMTSSCLTGGRGADEGHSLNMASNLSRIWYTPYNVCS